ncbi:S24 family peptidase [Neobacillus sp. 3P2-tot-E-2]|uniref:LexA family protein n=1 Tax=Neobacillus sp. 3P2-tot-E-2 TaxID=3132212 RepID=UPI00399F89FC
MDKKGIGKKIRELRENRNMFAEDLAGILKVSKSTIYMWEGGNRTPDIFQLMAIADFFNVDLDTLTGREMKSDLQYMFPDSETMRVPIIGEVKAGYDLLADQNIIGYEFVPKSMLKGGEYFYLKVTGDSMKDANISEGDLVLVRRQPAVDEGQVAVVLLDNNEITIKRVHYEKNEQVILHSDNTNYPPRLFKFNEIKIQGLVKQIIKKVV